MAHSAKAGNLLLHLTVHDVQISIPPSINLVICCICNDQKYETPIRRKIDASTKIVNFQDQELVIDLKQGGDH